MVKLRRYLSSPSPEMTFMALSSFCLFVNVFGRRRRAEYVKVSLTVRCGNTTSSCSTKPILFNTKNLLSRVKLSIVTHTFFLGIRKNSVGLGFLHCNDECVCAHISNILSPLFEPFGVWLVIVSDAATMALNINPSTEQVQQSCFTTS